MNRLNKFKLPFASIGRYHSTSAIVSKPPPPILQPNPSIPLHNLSRSHGVSSSPFLRLHSGHFNHPSKRSKMVFSGLLLCGGFLYFLLEKKVPYTNRNRILICTDVRSTKLGENGLQRLKNQSPKVYILPATHPRSVQVCSVLQKLLYTLHRDLGLNETPVVTCRGLSATTVNEKGTITIDSSSREITSKIRKWNTDVRHLKGKNWQVVVVDEHERIVECLGDGIIVISTGLLDGLSDVELATVVAHEVGHCVARHFAEGVDLVYALCFVYIARINKFVDTKRLVADYERRVQIEADYISLLLMASTGYDPNIVVQVYGKVEPYYQAGEDSVIPVEERVRLLSQRHVMEEARTIYRLAKGSK